MSTTAKGLFPTQYAPNSQTTVYTATAVRTILDKFVAYNGSASPTTLAVNIVPSGGTAGGSNLIVNKTLNAGETYTFPEVVGNVLNAGDFVSVLAGAASAVVIRGGGREMT